MARKADNGSDAERDGIDRHADLQSNALIIDKGTAAIDHVHSRKAPVKKARRGPRSRMSAEKVQNWRS